MTPLRLLPFLLMLCLLAGATALGQLCPPVDHPDPLFQDTNFDGIDGDTSRAIFVSGTSGDDLNPGTFSLPVKTVEQGVLLAKLSSTTKDVYVAAGTYTLGSTLVIPDSVGIYGLFSGPPTWQRSNANVTTISGPSTLISISNVTFEAHVEGFVLNAGAGLTFGVSSYGVRIANCAGPVSIRYNTIHASVGTLGSGGASGGVGPNGLSGNPGFPGSCDNGNGGGGAGGTSPCVRSGGAGGAGGPEGPNNGFTGAPGAGGTAGGNGGLGSYDPSIFSCSAVGGPGGPGLNGTAGPAGLNGSAAPSLGVLGAGGYLTANGSNGTAGLPGNGGGGGGGGGGQGGVICNDGGGNGGGGGGAGGCGGTQGGGAGGGGGSFGVYSYNSNAIIVGNTITTSNGGAGGHGGNGGAGGLGGPGGAGANICTTEVGAGGSGGSGGNGGNGGPGSGGTGGPSVGIMAVGSSPMAASNTITVGLGGNAGPGGTSPSATAPAGSAGVSQQIYGTTSPLVLPTPSACLSDVVVNEPYPGQTAATFTIFLSNESATQVDIDYATEDSSTTAGSDYVVASGTLSFAPGEIMKQIGVQVKSDLVSEPDEVFYLRLSNAVGATIVDSTGRGVIVDYPLSSAQYPVHARWNLVSLPMLVGNDSVAHLYPTAVSSAFIFQPEAGYAVRETLDNGPGYWLKFGADQLVNMEGIPVITDTVPVKAGWNLIGSITDSIPTSGVLTIPGGLIASSFYGYEGGYAVATEIRPGRGYWLKANDSGMVVLSSAALFAHAQPVQVANALAGMNTFLITDRDGNAQTLVFGTPRSELRSLDAYELPPAPPQGAFDARFATGRSVALVEQAVAQRIPVKIASSHYPVRIAWNVQQFALTATLHVGGQSYDLTSNGSALLTGPGESVELVLAAAPAVPHAYSLDQNYPNPFNPTTTISFGLPEATHVRLSIYNLLGQEVARLVDEEKRAGYYQTVWDASQAPSGIYFYRLQTGSFMETRKLMLIK